MATNVWHMLRDALTEVGELHENVATGGSATTVVDSKLAGSDDDWNNGTVIITRDSAGAAAAPEGEFALVTDYASGTGTITVAASALSAAPASGDNYGVATNYYPMVQVVRAINRGLQMMGDIPQVDLATLTTASNQTEYAASLAWKRHPPFRIDMQGKLSDTNDYKWHKMSDWEYTPATAGNTGLIILPQLVTGRLLRIWFEDAHAAVNDFDDVIYEGFFPEMVLRETVYNLLLWKNGETGGADASVINMLNNAEEKREEVKRETSVWKPPRHSKLMILGNKINRDQFTYPDPP